MEDEIYARCDAATKQKIRELAAYYGGSITAAVIRIVNEQHDRVFSGRIPSDDKPRRQRKRRASRK